MIGILLAAGFSRRFGREDKLMQPLADGRSIALAAAENLIQAIPLSIAVVRPENKALAAQLKNAGLSIVYAEAKQSGMGDNLSIAVQYAATFSESDSGFIVALADMPYIRAETIRAIAQTLAAGAAIAAPVYRNQRGHPVGFSTRFRSELEALRGDDGARAILQRHADQLMLVECHDSGILTDIDTPQDLMTTQHI